jgi:predicted PurR-regulated permease PerM
MGLNLLALLGVAIALWLGESIFIPLTIAVLLAAILWPLVEWMNNRGVPWGLASIASVLMLVFLFLAITMGFILAIPRVFEGLPKPNDPDGQKQFYSEIRSQVTKVANIPDDSKVLPRDADESGLFQYLKKTFQGEYVTNLFWRFTDYLRSWVLEFVLIMFITLFLLWEGRMLSRRLVEIFGPSQEATLKAQSRRSKRCGR